MKKLYLIITVLVSSPITAGVFSDLESNFYKNPAELFRSFVYDAENLGPSFFKKHLPKEWRKITKTDLDVAAKNDWENRFSLSTSFLSDALGVFNYYITGIPLKEGVYIPQITLGTGHLFYIPLHHFFIDGQYSEIFRNLTFNSISGSFIVSKSTSHTTKFFSGYRYNYSQLKVFFPSLKSDLVEKTYRDTWHLHTVVLGFTHLLDSSDWEISYYLGHTILTLDFYFKFEANYKFIGLGLGIYPNHSVMIKPQLRFFIDI